MLQERHSISVDQLIEHGLDWLYENQAPEGYWVGMLETNAGMEAEWILALHCARHAGRSENRRAAPRYTR